MKFTERQVRRGVKATLYVKAKQGVTACLQRHFKQLCSRCPKYVGCIRYANYIQRWTELEREVNG